MLKATAVYSAINSAIFSDTIRLIDLKTTVSSKAKKVALNTVAKITIKVFQ